MKTTEQKKENNKTIMEIIVCFHPTGQEIDQYKNILRVLNTELLKKYCKLHNISKEQLINMIIELRYYSYLLDKKEEVFYALTSVSNGLLLSKEVSLGEIIKTLELKLQGLRKKIIKN